MKNSLYICLVMSMLFLMTTALTQTAQAQCAMCSLNAENTAQDDSSKGKGLNDGILFLLSMPFVIGAGMGLLWYKRFRQTETKSTYL